MGAGQVTVEPVTLIRKAAHGNLEAMRSLRECSASLAASLDDEEQRLNALYEASLFGRMAAELGELADRASLMALLALQTDILRTSDNADDLEAATEFEAEAMALAELVAEQGGEGSEEAATMIVANADAIAPDVMARAKHYRILWGKT